MIEGNYIKLRGLELKDAEIIHRHINNLDLRTYLGFKSPRSLEEVVDFIRNSWVGRKSGNFLLGIELMEKNELIGTISLEQVLEFSSSGRIGIAIWEEKNHSKGYGTEAI